MDALAGSAPDAPAKACVASSSSQATSTKGAVSAGASHVLHTLAIASMATADTPPPSTTYTHIAVEGTRNVATASPTR